MATDAQPGKVLGGRYRLDAELGSGGFGRVWKAWDTSLDRVVAVKEMWMPVMSPAERAERLTRAGREARNAAALADHPNIVTVHDVVVEDEAPWIVMQFVAGVSLQTHLATRGPLPPDQAAEVARGLLAALGAAHAAGIVHRDVKPANVLLADDGGVLLTDFGIAVAEGDQTLTVSGSFLGSVAYTAPERAEGRDGLPASDLFSLGATLFEAVEGLSPFQRDTRTGTLTALLVNPTPPMRQAGRLAPLINALLVKDPDGRPSVAGALEALAASKTAQPVEADRGAEADRGVEADRSPAEPTGPAAEAAGPAATQEHPTLVLRPGSEPTRAAATLDPAAGDPADAMSTVVLRPGQNPPTLPMPTVADVPPAPTASPTPPAAAAPPAVSAPPTLSAAVPPNPWLNQPQPSAAPAYAAYPPPPNQPPGQPPMPPWPGAGTHPPAAKRSPGPVIAAVAVAVVLVIVAVIAFTGNKKGDTVDTAGTGVTTTTSSAPDAPTAAMSFPSYNPQPSQGSDSTAPDQPTSAYVPAPDPVTSDLMQSARVGDCFYDNGVGSQADLSTAPCNPGAWQVVQINTATTSLSSCDNVKDSNESVSSSLHDLVLCLSYLSPGGTAYHAHPGDCVFGPNSADSVWDKEPCQTGNFKVTSRIPGTTDDSRCNANGTWDEAQWFTVTKDSSMDVLLCLDMNWPDAAGSAPQNACLSKSGSDSHPVFSNVSSCSQANVIITGRTSTYDDPSFCGSDGAAWWQSADFPKIAYTVCWRWK